MGYAAVGGSGCRVCGGKAGVGVGRAGRGLVG